MRGALSRGWHSDFAYSFRRSPLAIISAGVTATILLAAVLAPWVAPHNPYDLATVSVLDARMVELRWLLEELRVSFFAQELRTPQPVSVKRLEKVWTQLSS